MFDQTEIRPPLLAIPLISQVLYYPSISSTNDLLRDLLRQDIQPNVPHGTLVVADEQTAGRGQAGRQWATPRGQALASTCLLRLEHLASPGRLALLGGLAAALAIEQCTGLPTCIKWPNDVWVKGSKVGGVLAETNFSGNRLEWTLVGIGINVNGQLPANLNTRHPATTLQAELGRPVARLELLAALWRTFDVWLHRLDGPDFLAAVNARLLWRGLAVQVIDRQRAMIRTGILQGVAATGELALQTLGAEVFHVAAGEVNALL